MSPAAFLILSLAALALYCAAVRILPEPDGH